MHGRLEGFRDLGLGVRIWFRVLGFRALVINQYVLSDAYPRASILNKHRTAWLLHNIQLGVRAASGFDGLRRGPVRARGGRQSAQGAWEYMYIKMDYISIFPYQPPVSFTGIRKLLVNSRGWEA